MKLSINGCFSHAVRLAFMGGTVGAAISPVIAAADDVTQLQGVQVTGSLIRRTDTETASPVLSISRAQITQSGATSLEQLLYTLPSLTGVSSNSQVNNGGTGGGATVSLRGLGSQRTLVLLDGKRIVFRDVNSIPINMIDHIDVLNVGAGTVYGSDAIGGVVNFITRKNFHGTEVDASYGEASDHGDDRRQALSITHGITGEKGSMVFGASFDKQESVSALNRATTANQYAIYQGAVVQNASGTIPSGVYTLSNPSQYAGVATTGTTKGKTFNFIDSNGRGCNSVTKAPGATGNTFDLADYECVASLPINSQTYNFQAQNYASVPASHLSLFTNGKQNFTDDLQGYVSTLYTHDTGRIQLAPEPFISNGNVDASGNVIPITYSSASQYNPFGQDVSTFKFRAVQAGDRATTSDVSFLQTTVGLKATILDRFEWDNSLSYGREDTVSTSYGGFNLTDINNKLGPSQNGVCYTDATYTTVVPACTPIDLVGTTGIGYGGLSSSVQDHFIQNLEVAASNINGELFKLPAGPVSLALGLDYYHIALSDNPDGLQQTFEITDYSGSATKGAYDDREAYVEVLVPILKDVPGFSSLNVDLGERYSHYSDFKDNHTEVCT